MAKIVISYRRSDSAAIAGRIRDRLVAHYGAQSVFMDIENIPFGSDFREHIRNELLQSDSLIVVVGPDWIGRGSGAVSRIQQETDPVRIEVETGLRGGIPIIPLLVERARMPEPTDLPESLQNFAFINAAEVDIGRDFHQHMERLIQALDDIIAARSKSATAAGRPAVKPAAVSAGGRSPLPLIAAAIAVLAVLAGGSWWFLAGRGAPSAPVPPQTAVQPAQQAASAPVPLRVAQDQRPPTPAAGPATASPSPSCASTAAPVFADNFKSIDNGWKTLGKTRIGSEASYENGEMLLRAAANNTKWIAYPAVVVRNATVCVEVKSPMDAEGTQNTAGGIIFWADTDNIDNVYTAHIYPDGGYAVLRKNSKTWSVIVRKNGAPSVRRGPGAVNVVKVQLKNNTATLLINGDRVEEFRGEPPDSGGTVGLFARAPAGSQPPWRFIKLSVVEYRD